MVEPFSTAAAALGAADIAIKSIIAISKMISSLSRASAELKYLQKRLVSLGQLLLHIAHFQSSQSADKWTQIDGDTTRSINHELHVCIEDLAELDEILGRPTRAPSSRLNRFGKAIKMTLAEDRIQMIAQRVEERKSALSLLLQVVSRHNERHARKTLSNISEQQNTIQNVLQNNGTMLSNNGALLQNIRAQTSMATQRLETLSKLVDTKLTKLERLDRLINDIPIIVSRSRNGDSTIAVNGSATEAAKSLPLVLPFLRGAFQNMNRQHGHPLLSSRDMSWLEQEFESLHLAVMRDATRDYLQHHSRSGRLHRRACQPKPPQEFPMPRFHRDINPTRTGPPLRFTISRQTKLDAEILTGRIVLSISESAYDTSFSGPGRFIDGVSLLFLPSTNLPSGPAGFVVSSTYEWETGISVSPILTTFGVISAQEPVWRVIEAGDIKGLQQLLNQRQFQPWDRDAQSGNSLLAWAAWNHQVEVCNFLIEEGADCMDCDRDGSSALSVYLQAIRHNHIPGSQIVEGSRLLITACGSDISESDRHITWDGSTTGTFSHGIVHRAILETFQDWMDDRALQSCLDTLEILLQRGADPNERNGWGRTPLVTATFQVCLRMLPRVLKLMLKYKADPKTVDGEGDGILTRLFPTLSCCDISGMGQAWAEQMTDVIAIFLKAGCSPNLCGDDGWTPSDNCLTPATWVIWCEAVSRAGLDMTVILKADDRRDSLSWSEDELSAIYRETLQSKRQASDHWLVYRSHSDPTRCHLCGSQESWHPVRRPFDLLGSYFKAGFSYHQSLHNHADGSICTNYVAPSSCAVGEHDCVGSPLWPTTEDFSWRKHVAYRLWNNGMLGSSIREAHKWATESPDKG